MKANFCSFTLGSGCRVRFTMDLFSSYVLFSHFRPRDATLGNSFSEMSSYARAHVRITCEKNKSKIPIRKSHGLKWENKTYKLKRSIAMYLPRRIVDTNIPYRQGVEWYWRKASDDQLTHRSFFLLRNVTKYLSLFSGNLEF